MKLKKIRSLLDLPLLADTVERDIRDKLPQMRLVTK